MRKLTFRKKTKIEQLWDTGWGPTGETPLPRVLGLPPPRQSQETNYVGTTLFTREVPTVAEEEDVAASYYDTMARPRQYAPPDGSSPSSFGSSFGRRRSDDSRKSKSTKSRRFSEALAVATRSNEQCRRADLNERW